MALVNGANKRVYMRAEDKKTMARSYSLIADDLVDRGERELGKEIYRMAALIEPNIAIYNLLGTMASGDQQWAEALDWWQTSLALQPGQVYTLRKAGQTAYRLERYERALDLLTQAVELDQGLSVEQKVQDYTMLAEEAEKLGDTERATELRRRAGR